MRIAFILGSIIAISSIIWALYLVIEVLFFGVNLAQPGIMSLLVGYFLLNEHISLQKIIGCIIVITGIILEILFKNISNIKSF